ncbi:MAG: helix-turn-helix domain-containing protein [Ruminococcus sp.]|nr:helix-turn-helix domain-containing protein [Ruminococcus sp.]MCM1382879.1 helix-turn-helix domain-containing protein [Muribaculaceae bacterium]MCM1480931.1 helix-turn-helix domain-containing protein [Muribaculaceae bacterium]
MFFIQNYKLYQRVRDCREDCDLSQAELAKKLSMGTTQYRRYELANSPISLELAEILANFYNVSLDYLAGRTKDKKGFNKSDLPSSEVDLLKKFRTLSEKQRGIIIGRIEAFTEENAEIEAKEERLKGAV